MSYGYTNLTAYIAIYNDSIVYTYGVGNERIKARHYTGGQLTRTTWYARNFERVVEGSTEKFYHWIQSPAGPVALVIKVTGGATTIYYLCTDHLNSITGVMDAAGNMTEEYSYDAWGRRRSPVNWSTASVTMPVITNRGFTGHEHLDAFDLIHMNGRIYDPHLARVLNPDPIIQDPADIQNYNRYSYCLNNPLRYIDPSGYQNDDNCGPKRKPPNWWSLFTGDVRDFWGYIKQTLDVDEGGGGTGYSGGSETFTYIPGISTYNPVPYTSSFSGYGGGSGHSDGYSPGRVGSIQGPVVAVAQSGGAINYFQSTWDPTKRAGGYFDSDFTHGILGSFNLVNLAAKGLPIIPYVFSTGGIIVSVWNITSIMSDSKSPYHTLGDKIRLYDNISFMFLDLVIPFSGLIPSIADSYGFFEYTYHQMDVYDATGYWVYYNFYTRKWKEIKITKNL